MILINPNDFGIEYSFRELPEVKVNPTKGFLSPNSKKKEVLIFSFIDYLDEKAYLIVESKKINNRGDSFGVLPSIGVKITNKQNSQDSTQEKSNIEPRNLGDELEDVKIIKIPRKERITDSVSKPFSFSPKTEVIFLIVIIIVLGLCLLYIFLKEKIEIKINKQ